MKIKVYIIILNIFCVISSIHAQISMYEFRYHFGKDTSEYKAFVLRNHDGTGFIRVNYFDHINNTPVLVDMLLDESFDKDTGGKEDTTLLIFQGKDPKIISGTKDSLYDPDIFLLQKSDTARFYDPVGVESYISLTDSWLSGDITQMRLLTKTDLTKEFVLTFFQQSEDFYVNLFETSERNATPQEKSASLYLLVVANTNDATIGKTCVIDKDATLETFKNIAEYLEIQFVPKEISGNDYSKKNVAKAIKALKPSVNDVVVFYYSGHGFCDTTDNHLFPYLDLRDKVFQIPGAPYQLNMEDIYKVIKAKGARFNLVFSDCCNSAIGDPPAVSKNVVSTRASSLGWSKDNCRTLFLDDKKSSILMTAASKGEESGGNTNDGGIFTFNFRETMEKFMAPLYKNISWDKIVETAQTLTITKAKKSICPQQDGITYKSCRQTPIVKYN